MQTKQQQASEHEIDLTTDISASSTVVWGPVGSPGRSTVAINLADTLCRMGRRVLLVDCDLQGPSLAIQLGLNDAASGLAIASAMARRAELNPQTLEENVVRFSGPVKFALLVGITGVSRWPEITPSAIDTIRICASRNFDDVIFDVSASLEPALRTEASAMHRNELSRHLVATSERVIAVAGSDPISTARMLRQILDVQKMHGDTGLHLVVNRVRERVLGSKPEQQLMRTYRDLVKMVPTAFLPDEPASFDSAMRHGVPIRLIRRRSPYLASLARFAQELHE